MLTYYNNKIIKLSEDHWRWGGAWTHRSRKRLNWMGVQFKFQYQCHAILSDVLGYSVLLLTASNLLQIIVKASEFWNDLLLTQFRAYNSSITCLLLTCIFLYFGVELQVVHGELLISLVRSMGGVSHILLSCVRVGKNAPENSLCLNSNCEKTKPICSLHILLFSCFFLPICALIWLDSNVSQAYLSIVFIPEIHNILRNTMFPELS